MISRLFKVDLDSIMMAKMDAFSSIRLRALAMPMQPVHHRFSIKHFGVENKTKLELVNKIFMTIGIKVFKT